MRNGKIAKLQNSIRDELNLRLENGENGPKLLAWLNGLPEVQATLKASFGGAPVSKQNLCEWRQGGFREWQRHREWMFEACELNHYTSDMEEIVETPLVAGDLAVLLAVRYAALLNTWDGEADPEFEQRVRLLRGVGKDVALMQRTLRRADLQQMEYYRRSDDELEEHKAKMNKMALSPISAALERHSLERMFGLYFEEDYAKKLAEFVTAVKHDLPLPKLVTAADPAPSVAGRSPPFPLPKPAKATEPSQTQSNPVKATK